MQKNEITIGLDLGGDALKIAFAYKDGAKLKYGKFDKSDEYMNIALPAVAYYDESKDIWKFSDEAERENSGSFLTIVKIKNLISLLSLITKDAEQKRLGIDTKAIRAKNVEYYYRGHKFPKFYFPIQRSKITDFDSVCKQGKAFECLSKTPQQVCEDFFCYIKSFVNRKVEQLGKEVKKEFTCLKLALVYPAKVGKEYIDELTRLIQNAFKIKPSKSLNCTKSLGQLAFYRKAVGVKDKLLVFDMGEENISVAKAFFIGNDMAVDGIDGHNLPLEYGGIDVDGAVYDYLADSIVKREILGIPSYGDEDRLQESGLYVKEYMLMKDIKIAKTVFSNPRLSKLFTEGVPITISREVAIQKLLESEEFKDCIYNGKRCVAENITEYVLKEIARPNNKDVTKVVLSGGLVETFSLLEHLQEKIKEFNGDIEVKTFDDYVDDGSCYHIQSYEDSAYAPALGAAIIALENLSVKTVFSWSYGTWIYRNDEKCLSVFVDKGRIIDENDSSKNRVVSTYTIGDSFGIKNEELFSTSVLMNETANSRQGVRYIDSYIYIGEYGTARRRAVEKLIDLKTIAGGKNVMVKYYYPTSTGELKRVAVVDFGGCTNNHFSFEEGIEVSFEGKAMPVYKIVNLGSDYVYVNYIDEDFKGQAVTEEMKNGAFKVQANKILLSVGIDEIDI